jgi:hypothetical protein
MTPLKNVRLQVEFDVIQPPSHEKAPAYMLVCKKCHNIQTFLEYSIGAEEPV